MIMTACTPGSLRRQIMGENEEEIADATFLEIVDAVKTKNSSHIKDMFSIAIQKENSTLENDAIELVEFIQGDIISYTEAMDGGIATDDEIEDGKRKKEITSAFDIVTTENKYHIAIKECVKDDFNAENVGLLYICIIDSQNWTEDYIYGGKDKTNGINIER